MEIKCQLDATDDFYCRSYCLLNMFRAPLCPSSGAREYYTSGCCCSQQTGHITLSSTPYRQLENQTPNKTGSNHMYKTLELLMMVIKVPETCWASNRICNKNHLLHLVGILFPHINDDAQSKPHQIENCVVLSHYAASNSNFLPTFPETSVWNYHYSLSNDPEERSSHLLRGGRLQWRYFLWQKSNIIKESNLEKNYQIFTLPF